MSLRPITPLNGYVLLRRVEDIVCKSASQDALSVGQVVALGPVLALGMETVLVGSCVLYCRYGGPEFELDGESQLTFVREEELLGVTTDSRRPVT